MKPSRIRKQFVDTPLARVAYVEAGDPKTPTVLLVHGIPTSSYLWRDVIDVLKREFHCLAPDLMGLGDTVVDPTADLGMVRQAEMLDAFLDAIGVGKVHLVAHDQGGAAGQIFATRFTARVRRLVLTDCVAYDNWPVPAIRQMQLYAKLPFADWVNRTGLMQWIETDTRLSKFRRGVARRSRMSSDSIAEYLRPLQGTRDERRRFMQFVLAGSASCTMAVAPALRNLFVPTMVLWGAEDRYIPARWGRRLYEDIPGAERFELMADAGHFWQEERPEAFARSIGGFLRIKAARPKRPRLRVVDGCQRRPRPLAATTNAAVKEAP